MRAEQTSWLRSGDSHGRSLNWCSNAQAQCTSCGHVHSLGNGSVETHVALDLPGESVDPATSLQNLLDAWAAPREMSDSVCYSCLQRTSSQQVTLISKVCTRKTVGIVVGSQPLRRWEYWSAWWHVKKSRKKYQIDGHCWCRAATETVGAGFCGSFTCISSCVCLRRGRAGLVCVSVLSSVHVYSSSGNPDANDARRITLNDEIPPAPKNVFSLFHPYDPSPFSCRRVVPQPRHPPRHLQHWW